MIKPLFPFLLILSTVLVKPLQAQKIPLYVGTYTQPEGSKGIYSYLFDTKTADVTLVSETATPSPSFIARRGNLLLAANELTGSGQAVSAFQIQDGQLKFLNTLPTSGEAPCHVVIDPKGKYAVVSNYLGGALDLYSINAEGLIRQEDYKKYSGSSVDPKRQEASHVHSAFLGPDGLLYVSDLGTDQIHILKVVSDAGQYRFQEVASLETPKGAGPRHVAFSPNGKTLYALMEMSGDIVVYKKLGNSWNEKQQISMNADDFKGKNGAADIKVSKDGKFLYASNRVDANSISSFAINSDGSLKKLQVLSVEGKGPRNFTFSPDERFILVGNQLSDEVVIFARDQKSGLLSDSGKRFPAFKPVCLIF